MQLAVNDHVRLENSVTKEYSQLRIIEVLVYHGQFIIYGEDNAGHTRDESPLVHPDNALDGMIFPGRILNNMYTWVVFALV